MTAPKRQDIQALKAFLPKMVQAKAAAAKARDRLRELQSELNDIADSFDNADDLLDSAKRNLEEAVAEMSKYV